jgi:hypothetical protein
MDDQSGRSSSWSMTLYLSDVEGGERNVRPIARQRQAGVASLLPLLMSGKQQRWQLNYEDKHKHNRSKRAASAPSNIDTVRVVPRAGTVLVQYHGLGGERLTYRDEKVESGDLWLLRMDVLG